MLVKMIRNYEELSSLKTFEERYKYLRLGGLIGESTFGFDRWINQNLYGSIQWKKARDIVIVRDDGCDLGVRGYELSSYIIVHHMNPLSIEDIENGNPDVFNPRFLISVSRKTHLAIHFGDDSLLPKLPIERRPWDTVPWR